MDIVINLAGKSLNSGRWTHNTKQQLINSRLEATNALMNIVEQLPIKPKLLLNASAIGIYGTSETKIFSETDKAAHDFLATTVSKWEECASSRAAQNNIRTVFCRFGVVLSNKGGALPSLILPYKLFLGGKIASGKQWVSWIHIDDVVKALLFIVKNDSIYGPVNFTTTSPVNMMELGSIISKHLHRPNYFPLPSTLLKAVLGEMSILITEGQNVFPHQLVNHGYSYKFNSIEAAISDLY